MTNGSNNSSPTDFAFELPVMSNNSVVGLRSDKPLPFPIYTPSSYTHLNISMPQYGYSSASSFSSASEATGSSFSSADALPAISRNFVRPSPTETRRPATAGGALQTRSPFVGFMEDGDRFQRLNQRSSTASAEVSHASQVSQTIDEGSESVFGNPNPFSSPIDKENGRLLASQTPASTLDNHYASHVDDTRTMYQQSPGSLHYSSSPFNSYLPITSAPTSSYHDNFTPSINANQQLQQFQRPMSDSARPQTSDGLPRYASVGSGVSLPSARTLVNQIDAFATPQTFFSPRRNETLQPTSLMPFRDSRATSLGNNQDANTSNRAYSIDSSKTARPSYIHPSSPMNSEDDPQGELTFVSTGGSGPKKRPRRRFDEIERLYTCGWNGCEKAYGTLNHLNAHVAMQKHGIKRLPSEFKDMRRAWRKSKREHTVILPNGRSVSVGSNSPNQRHNNESDSSDSDLDRRNNITSMMPIPEGESMFYAPAYVYEDSRPTTSSSVVSSAADDRRSYVPPQYPHTMHPGSITARRPSAPGYLPMPPQMPQNFRHTPSGYPTPTQQNPFPMSMRQDYPFQTLTSPMPMVMGVGSAHHFDSQFAFQG